MSSEKDKPFIDAIDKALGPLQIAIANAIEAGLGVTIMAHFGLGIKKLDTHDEGFKPFYVKVTRTLRTRRP